MNTNSNSTVLSAVLWPTTGVVSKDWLRAVALAVGGTCLLTLSARVQIPFWPVPMTLQTLVILLLGLTYGLRQVSATMLLYLCVGALGAPVFAKGGGLAYMAGPTGGYLVGFLVSAAAMGYLGDRGWGKTVSSMILPMLLGTALIFVFGVSWLAYLIGWEKAIVGGLYPFIASAMTKIVVAIFLLPFAWRLIRNESEKDSG